MVTPWFQTVPYVTLLILGVSLAISFLTNLVTKWKVDIKAERVVRNESNAAMKEYREALKTGDQGKIEKAKKRQSVAQKQMMATSSVRMKVSLYFLVPILIVFYVLNVFIPYTTPAAISPLPFNLLNYFVAKPIGNMGLGAMNFITWYFFVSLSTNLIIARLMGTNP
jgi:uncharacterized membrane protein (DUF106 family)